MDYIQLPFGDEIPAIGCGFHSVLVMGEEGSKQVTLLKVASCDDGVLPRAVYADMARNRNSKPWPLDADKIADLIPRIIKNAEMYEKFTPTVRQALLGLGVLPEDLPPQLQGAARVGSTIAVGEGVALSDAETPLSGEGSGKMMQRLWMTGRYTPDDLVAIVLTNWPGRKTKVSDVFFNYRLLIKAGVADVPPWPAKK